MKRPMSNEELISHLMQHSKHGAMMQLIVVEGLRNYCAAIIKAPAGFLGEAAMMFSEDAWRSCCQEYLDTLDNREQLTVEVGQHYPGGIEEDEPEEQGDLFEAEKAGLFKVLDHLDDHGWRPIELWDTEEWLTFSPGLSLQAKVKEAAQTDMATLRLRHDDGRIGSIGLVWGNSPIELIADHTTNHGFDEAVRAAQRSVWPNYPED
jgi:hypothetical protein